VASVSRTVGDDVRLKMPSFIQVPRFFAWFRVRSTQPPLVRMR
jgi:hypothetical protein